VALQEAYHLCAFISPHEAHLYPPRRLGLARPAATACATTESVTPSAPALPEYLALGNPSKATADTGQPAEHYGEDKGGVKEQYNETR
jgi:hypothetical protein